MRTFKIEQSKTDIITPHRGLALVGHCLNNQTSLAKTSRTIIKCHGIATIDLIRTYLGLICLGCDSVLMRMLKYPSRPIWAKKEFIHTLDHVVPRVRRLTSAPVLGCNILRWMGQRALLGPDAPVRHKAKRHRIRTVMQELMYMACRLVSSGRQLTNQTLMRLSLQAQGNLWPCRSIRSKNNPLSIKSSLEITSTDNMTLTNVG